MFITILASLITAPTTWTLVAGGDLMFYAIDPKRRSLTAIKETFQKADVAYANLEIPLTNAKTRTPYKSEKDVAAKRQFILKGDPKHIAELKGIGLDFVSLGNNHAMDYRFQGLHEMIDLLDKAGIGHSGAGDTLAEAEKPAVKKLPNGLRVGMVSYLAFAGTAAHNRCTPAKDQSPGIAVLDFGATIDKKARARLAQIVKRAREDCDVLLVALHWGIERQSKPAPYQIALGRAFIDAGADAVLGAHPHVLQSKEVYSGKPILYSMGNLISPLPARSGVYTLKFDGRKFLSCTVRPMDNAGGKTAWLPKAAEPARIREIEALDHLISKRRAANPAKKRPARKPIAAGGP